METVWLSVCYPGDFTIGTDGSFSWEFVGGIDKGKSFPFRVPKNVSFVELCDKLEKKLKIDTSLYEMVLRCPYPVASKNPIPPYDIDDDDTVEWLISHCHGTTLYITLKLKANVVSDIGSTRTMMSVHNGENDINYQPELIANDNVRENDINYQPQVIVNDNVGEVVGVDDSPVVGVDVAVVSLISCETFPSPRIDRSLEVENMMVDDVHSLEDGLNDIEPTGVPKVDRRGGGENVIPSFSVSRPSSSLRIPEGEDLHVTDFFETKRHLMDKLEMIAVKFHFEFKSKKSNTTTYRVLCNNEQCMWRLTASCVGHSKGFQVRKYNCPHSCSLTVHKKHHKNASYKMVGRLIAEKFQDPKRAYQPRDIINDFCQQYGYELTYTTAYNAQIYAIALIRRYASDSFGKLPKFFHSLELANPGKPGETRKKPKKCGAPMGPGETSKKTKKFGEPREPVETSKEPPKKCGEAREPGKKRKEPTKCGEPGKKPKKKKPTKYGETREPEETSNELEKCGESGMPGETRKKPQKYGSLESLVSR